MTEEEQRIKADAVAFAKANKNKTEIAKRRTDVKRFPPDTQPVSVFMAGSPGAGKTESSFRLIERLTGGRDGVLRIDSDELRSEFAAYNGTNSYLFQGATSILADRMQDLALHNNQSYVFGGTLSNLERTRENIRRSLDHERLVQILYVYQDPLQAWNAVQAREKRDGRMVPKDSFIEQYFLSHENVDTLKAEFGKQIRVDLIVKNTDGTDFRYKENIDVIDSYVDERYSRDTLRAVLENL
ncbi:MAG: zeta toxin family protein [Minisyncoccota bacterium]